MKKIDLSLKSRMKDWKERCKEFDDVERVRHNARKRLAKQALEEIKKRLKRNKSVKYVNGNFDGTPVIYCYKPKHPMAYFRFLITKPTELLIVGVPGKTLKYKNLEAAIKRFVKEVKAVQP